MPHTYIALPRGINVGKAKRISMAELRTSLEGMGFRRVRTLLNSGNVVFESESVLDELAPELIRQHVLTTLGVAAHMSLLTRAELAELIDHNTLAEVASDPSRLLVHVLRNNPDVELLRPLLDQDWSPEVLALGPRVAYVWCANGILESKLAPAVAKTLKNQVTARNWSTVLKLKALADR